MKFTYFDTKKQREREKKFEQDFLKRLKQEQVESNGVKTTESFPRIGIIPDTPFSYNVKDGHHPNEVYVEIFFIGTFPKIVSRYYKISRSSHVAEPYFPAGIPTRKSSYEYKWLEKVRAGEVRHDSNWYYARVSSFVDRYSTELVKSVE